MSPSVHPCREWPAAIDHNPRTINAKPYYKHFATFSGHSVDYHVLDFISFHPRVRIRIWVWNSVRQCEVFAYSPNKLNELLLTMFSDVLMSTFRNATKVVSRTSLEVLLKKDSMCVSLCRAVVHVMQCVNAKIFTMKTTRCSAIAERPRCTVRYSFRQK